MHEGARAAAAASGSPTPPRRRGPSRPASLSTLYRLVADGHRGGANYPSAGSFGSCVADGRCQHVSKPGYVASIPVRCTLFLDRERSHGGVVQVGF